MLRRLAIPSVLVLLSACVADSDVPLDEGDTGTTEASTTAETDGDGDGEGDEVGDGDGDTAGDGDGDGDTGGDGDGDGGPANMPTPTGQCPSFATGNADVSAEGIDTRTVKFWSDDSAASDGGALVIYWHAYTSAPDEAVFGLSQAVIDEITAQGGAVVAPYAADDVGQFPWFSVNGSTRQDDMILADELVACAVQQLGVDPSRIHSVGMSAGGLQTAAFAMARSRYIASVSTYSGGVYGTPAFEDPSNHFAAMIFHGGDSDLFGGTVNFKTLSTAWLNQLHGNGHFAFMCDHGNGHTLPQGVGDDVWAFFQAHTFGTEPSPYDGGLPGSFPSYCAL